MRNSQRGDETIRGGGAQFDYAKYLNERIKRGGYYPKFRDYPRAFSHKASDLLLHLLNVGKGKATGDGFVQATPRFLEDGISLTKADQDRILKGLEEERVVEVTYRGKPAVRYIRVDTERIEALIRQTS